MDTLNFEQTVTSSYIVFKPKTMKRDDEDVVSSGSDTESESEEDEDTVYLI